MGGEGSTHFPQHNNSAGFLCKLHLVSHEDNCFVIKETADYTTMKEGTIVL